MTTNWLHTPIADLPIGKKTPLEALLELYDKLDPSERDNLIEFFETFILYAHHAYDLTSEEPL